MSRTITAAAAPACLVLPLTAPLTRNTPYADRATPMATSSTETRSWSCDRNRKTRASIRIVILLDDRFDPAATTSLRRTNMIKVLVVDDQQLVRAGFRVILAAEPDLVVVGEAGDGAEALRRNRELQPDVVLMDIRMPNMDGLEAARRIIAASPARVLILTTFDADEYVYGALQAGASGFMLKDAPPEQLVAAVRAAAAGNALIDASVTRRFIAQFTKAVRPAAATPSELDLLTSRELEVLRLLTQGLSNSEIAANADRGGDDSQDPRQPDPDEARPAGPGAGGDPRLRDRLRAPGDSRVNVVPK